MFQRLRYRITLLSVILLVVLYAISSVAVYAIVRSDVIRSIDGQLLMAARHMIQAGNDPTAIIQPDIFGIVSDGQGDEIDTIPRNLASSLEHSINTKETGRQFLDVKRKGLHFRILFIPMTDNANQPQAYVATITEDSHELAVLSRLQRVIWIVGIFGLAGATLVGFILADRMLRPIKSAWQRQLEFVADASHELRTPLAVIQSNLGIVMEHTDENIDENLEWLNNAHSESRRLSKLVKDLLTLARSDSERMPVERNPVELQALIMHVHELYETIAEMRGIQMNVSSTTPITILGDSDRLHQLLVILLDNAVKFTPEGGTIELALSQQKQSAVLTIKDSGLGIDKENLARVFDRFFTVDPARTREHSTTGTGLGLSIARWIVDAHGGKISIHSDGLGQGTLVRVELPTGTKKGLPALGPGNTNEES